ncbi:MAG: hypothetical protein FD180_4233 [Planctomycetota bacterium]|nr:MAG: hypothetical protein FD180_4233 [Planctomycetota bacterium]
MADEAAGVMDKVKKSWELVKPNIVTWVIALIVGGLMNYVLLGGVALAGWTLMIQKSRAGEKIEVGDMFKAFDRFVDYFVTGLVCSLPFGLLLPWGIFYCVDKKADFMTSIKWSLSFFLKNLVPCIVNILICIVLIIIGECACCVGVFITAPIALFVSHMLYTDLGGNTAAGEAPAAPKV